MEVVLVGASGRGGSCILRELIERGHLVTAVARNADALAASDEVTVARADASDAVAMAEILRGKDAAITAVPFRSTDMRGLLRSMKTAGVPRLLVMGGAASLRLEDGSRLIDSPEFPPEYLPEARAAMAFLDDLKAEPELDWTFLSPAAVIEQGERTGSFRIGGEDLLVGADGVSRITFPDYAIAMVDELEGRSHSRKRFSVAY